MIGMIADGTIEAPLDLQRMAQMLQQMKLGGFSQQDEQDRRWENLSYEMEQLKEAGKQGFTGGEIQALIVKHGMQPTHPLTDSAARRSMKFDEFMKICGSRGMTLMTKFEAMTLPDAPRKCDCCSKRGARMRCSNCGETYCNSACQKKEWKDHRPVCRQAGRDHVCRVLPKLLSWDEYDYRVLGKPRPRPVGTNFNMEDHLPRSSSQNTSQVEQSAADTALEDPN